MPQEPRQATAATQPYPIGDSIVPQQIDIAPQRKPDEARLVNGGRIFTPFWTERIMVKPASLGGANWPPSSYDPESNLLFACATDRISTYAVTLPLAPPVDNQPCFGGNMGGMPGTERGVFATLDAFGESRRTSIRASLSRAAVGVWLRIGLFLVTGGPGHRDSEIASL